MSGKAQIGGPGIGATSPGHSRAGGRSRMSRGADPEARALDLALRGRSRVGGRSRMISRVY